MTQTKKKSLIYGLIVFAVLTFWDQFTKILAISHLKDKEPLVLIENVFKLRYLENPGAAFSILENQQLFFIILTSIMLIIILYVFIKLPMANRYKYLRYICVVLAAGAVGNLIDRIRFNYVVDFFYFELIDFPTFNVADIYITCTMIILVFLIMFYYKDDELEQIFKGQNK